jgi:hypothetical protein
MREAHHRNVNMSAVLELKIRKKPHRTPPNQTPPLRNIRDSTPRADLAPNISTPLVVRR